MRAEPAARQAALNDAFAQSVAPTAAVLAVLFGVFAIGHAALLPPGPRGVLVTAALTTTAGMAILARLVQSGRVAAAAAWACGAVMAVLVLGNAILHLGMVGEPRQTTNLILVLLGAGMFFLSWRLLLGVIAIAWIGFVSVERLLGAPSDEWQHFAFALASATALAVIVHGARVRVHDRLHLLRRQEEEKRGELLAATRALEESEQRHRLAVEGGLGIIATHDLAGALLSLNPAGAVALGRQLDEVVGASLRALVAPDFADDLDGYLTHVRSGRHSGLLHVRTADGAERLWDYRSVLHEERGREAYVVLHALDITERVRLENRLRSARGELAGRVRARTAELEAANESLREEIEHKRRIGERLLRYRRALEACSDAIVLAELDGTIVDGNAALIALCGVADESALVGRPLAELAAPEDRARAMRDVRLVVGGMTPPPQEYALVRGNGERIAVEASIAQVCDEDGDPLALVAVGRDVSWRKQMGTALRHSEAFLRTLIEHSTDTILVLDVDGTILARPNADAPVGRYGHPSASILGRLRRDFVHPEDTVAIAEAFTAVRGAPGATSSCECRIRDGGGAWRPSEILLCNLLDDPAVAGLMCTVRDLSARKQAEQALRQARDAAEAASQVKTDFLNTMSHELRTPIHAILGYAEMLREGAFGRLGVMQLDAVQRISERARDQFDLVSAMLDLSAMESGRTIIKTEQVRMAQVFEEVEREGRKVWSERALDMVWEVAHKLPPLASDAAKIRIIVRNLVGNAVKFTPQGSVIVRAQRARAGIAITVSDTGIGIAEEQRAVIFEPFFQVDGSETRRYEGCGLGLHIVKRLLDLLGGMITVESEVGCGSTFRVWLPMFPPVADLPGTHPVEEPDRTRTEVDAEAVAAASS